MDYKEEEDKNKKIFSGNTITIVAGVIALIIFSAVVSAYPHGMEISKAYDVVYDGSENMILTGKIGISGNINGIVASENIFSEQFSGIDEIIVRDGVSKRTFFDKGVVITGGDAEINLSVYVDEKFECAVVLFDSSNKTSIGIITEDIMHFTCSGDAILSVKNSSIAVGNGTWEGDGDFIIVLKGGFDASLDAEIFGISTDGAVNISVERGSGFDGELLNKFDIELPPLPFDFNGACAVSDGVVSIDGSPETIKNFSFLRGEGTAMVGKNVHLDMKAILLILDGDFYPNDGGTVLWFIPDRIIGLWPIAIATWVIAALLRKRFSTKIENYDKGLSGVAMIIHILAFFISFYLWDWEIRYEFGQSILSVAVESIRGGIAMEQWVIAPFEIIPWFAALVLIAIPINITLSLIFGLIGLERLGKGAGKATGMLMLFFAGIIYVSFFLNITISPLVKSFIGF